MITRHALTNDVRTTLVSSITTGSTSITINKASAPYKDPLPPDSAAENGAGIITIADSFTNPTAKEIVAYSSLTDNGDGTITLGGLIRGRESTIVSAFSAGAAVYQAVTAGELSNDLMALRHDLGGVEFYGYGGGRPSAIFEDYGAHVFTYWPSQPIFTLGPMPTDDMQEDLYHVRMEGGNGFLDIKLRQEGTVVADQSVIRADYFTFTSGDRPMVKIADLQCGRIEKNEAILIGSIDQAFASATTVDWTTHDIVRADLASNTTLTFVNNILVDGLFNQHRNRRLTLLVNLPNVANPGYTVTWPASVLWPNGSSAPSFSTGQNQIRQIDFLYDGTHYLAQSMQTYQL